MIQANELRIGNLVNVTCFGETNTANLTCISTKGFSLLSPSDIYVFEDFEDVSGIPLTEEWLLKFDQFYKWPTIEGEITTTCLEYKWIAERKWLVKYSEVNGDCSYISFKPIEYVHQLQNLYYSLVGQELTI